MSAPEDLKEIHTDELKDLWSANDQTKHPLKKLSDATKEICGGDEYMTKLAKTGVDLQAEDA